VNFARRTALLAVSVVVSGGLLTAVPASAAPSDGAEVTGIPGIRGVIDLPAKDRVTPAVPPGKAGTEAVQTLPGFGGYGKWSPNPSGSTPGDAIKACDTTGDGWGIQVWLDSDRDGYVDRKAKTNGHSAPYCSGWKTGNLPEHRTVDVAVIQVKGDTTGAWAQYEVSTS
jgi:hypothetical protein